MNGHGHEFGHEFVSESVSEADTDTDTRFFGSSDTDTDIDRVMTSDTGLDTLMSEYLGHGFGLGHDIVARKWSVMRLTERSVASNWPIQDSSHPWPNL